MTRINQNCQVKLKSAALKNQRRIEIWNKVLECKPTGLKSIAKLKEADYCYFRFDTHLNASVFYNLNRGSHLAMFGFERIVVLPARQNGKCIVYSQQTLGSQPVSSSHSAPAEPQPQPQPQPQAQAPAPSSPEPTARPSAAAWKRSFEEGVILLEQELQEKLDKRQRLDIEIAALNEKVKKAKELLDI
ncbi:hypothetical protein BDC45DRAFT_519122 [Circinella umbellata]|nr:hypothetical protein BDC45DRAFT_519122 [Circinella umbellata]